MAKNVEYRQLTGFQVKLVRSRRKTLTLIVCPDDSLEVRAPNQLALKEISRMIAQKTNWIQKQQRKNALLVDIYPLEPEQRKQADRMIHERARQLQDQYHLALPQRIVVRDLVSRWGSCSSRGSISINRRCCCLPPDLMDLVIIHEHCHLQEMNHSASFYDKLKYLVPDAATRTAALKKYRLSRKKASR